MEIENINETNVCVNENGKISFAPDVIATIANLAASEVAGVTGLGGGFADSISGILNSKKNYTKGVRVEVGNEEAAKVCSEVQNEVKKAVETMTGLRVVEVNVSVQAITFENRDNEDKADKKKRETEPRVK